MKLYPRKLNSIKDLEREKRIVARQAKELDMDDIFSMDMLSMAKGSGGEGDGGGGMLSSVLSMLPISNPILSMALPFIEGFISGKREKKKERKIVVEQTEGKPHKKSILRRVAMDVLTSYLKWKAIELSYKGVRYMVRRLKEKKANEAL